MSAEKGKEIKEGYFIAKPSKKSRSVKLGFSNFLHSDKSVDASLKKLPTTLTFSPSLDANGL